MSRPPFNINFPILEVRNLCKVFGKIIAVDRLSFEIHTSQKGGKCFGLLGPNGAGKTTTMEMMEGVKEPTSGEIFFRGKPIGSEYKNRIGIQFQSTALPDFLTCKDVLELFSSFYSSRMSIDKVSELCQLGEFLSRDHKKLSGGQRQRLLLGLAIIHNPDVLFLDEPTTGLDPQSRRRFWDLIEDIKNQGKVVLLSTHYMEEAYHLCDELIIMDHGKIIAKGAPNDLLQEHFKSRIMQLPMEQGTYNKIQLAFQNLEAIDLSFGNNQLMVKTKQVNKVLEALIAHGVDCEQMHIRSYNLDDLFLRLTGTALRE